MLLVCYAFAKIFMVTTRKLISDFSVFSNSTLSNVTSTFEFEPRLLTVSRCYIQ
jgi:hypothetical protein